MKKFICLLTVLTLACAPNLRKEVKSTQPSSSQAEKKTSSEPSNSASSNYLAPSSAPVPANEGASVAPSGETTPPFEWPRVAFTEVVADPQQDWNDSSGGNGIPFDEVVGNGTIGTTDEWIELKNNSGEPLDLRGWKILMIDGSDETEILDGMNENFRFSGGGSVENFLSDDFFLIGNPSGDLKNSLRLELYDELNELVDEVDLEDANAASVLDETYSRISDGSWIAGEATPLF